MPMISGAWPEGTRLRLKATRDPADSNLNGQAWHTEGRTYELEVQAEDELDRDTGVTLGSSPSLSPGRQPQPQPGRSLSRSLGRSFRLRLSLSTRLVSLQVANHVRLVDCEVHRAGHLQASSSSVRQGAASMQGVFKPERLRMLNERHWQQALLRQPSHVHVHATVYATRHAMCHAMCTPCARRLEPPPLSRSPRAWRAWLPGFGAVTALHSLYMVAAAARR